MIPMSDLERSRHLVRRRHEVERQHRVSRQGCVHSRSPHPVGAAGHRGQISDRNARRGFYRSAFVALLSIILVGPILGLGRAALEFVRQKASSRTIAYTFFEKQSASVAFQLQLADAAMMIDTAHFHAYRAADDIDQGRRARRLSRYADARAGARRHRLHGGKDHASNRQAVVCARLGGLRRTSPLQRIWRDAAVASRHAVALPPVGYELYGKALLGVKNDVTPLI